MRTMSAVGMRSPARPAGTVGPGPGSAPVASNPGGVVTPGPRGRSSRPGPEVAPHRHGGIAPVDGHHAPARMRRRPAQVHAGDGGPGPETPVPHLVGKAFTLEDVAAGQPDAL